MGCRPRGPPACATSSASCASLGVPALVGLEPGQGDLLVVLGLHDPGDRGPVADRAAAIVHAAAQRRAKTDVVVAVGAAGDWSALGGGLRDAAEASAVAARLPARPWHDATAMAVERLLWRLRDQEDVRRYVDRLLGAVVEHDARRRHPLMPTLEALCAAGGRRAEAARALHLNRQALYDRIARLERVLDADLSDPNTVFASARLTPAAPPGTGRTGRPAAVSPGLAYADRPAGCRSIAARANLRA
ncbi:MAG: helix-turn-helix domain-containing protein [Solirubrobacteraceae bacterium]